MESNDRVSEVSVQAHSRRESDRHVGKQTHAKGCQGSDCSSARDEVPMDDAEAKIVLYIICASWISCIVADAGSTAVCQDCRVDLLFSSVLICVREVGSHTEMIYAMAKKVARPARISVKNLAFSRDLA
jgi:hypothetical protein